MTDQTRADFESHFGLTSRQKWQHPDGSYKFPEIQAKWEGYLAGVAKAAPIAQFLAVLDASSGPTVQFNKDAPVIKALRVAAAAPAAVHPDTNRLDAIAANYWKLDPFDRPGIDDADVGWRVVQYHMGQPRERTVAEVFRDDPRAAIDEAMKTE